MYRRATAGLVCLVLGYAAPAAAQTSLSGFLEYDNITYLETEDEGKVNGRNAGTLQLELEHSGDETAAMFGSIELRVDQADAKRDRVFLDEAYLNLYLGDFDIRVGKQIYAWGRADGLNPTDNLAVWDYSDVLDTEDEKIGQVSIRADYYFGDWSVEGVFVPSFTRSVLPEPDSRWFSSFPDGTPALSISDPVLPDEGVDSFQYALKLSGSSGGWDYSVSWFDGFNDLPAVRIDTVLDAQTAAAGLVVQYSYHRRRAVGADFATVFGKLGAHGEVAYYLTEDWGGTDPAIDDPFLQYVLGVDYTFREVLAGQDLFLLAEWVQEVRVPDRGGTYAITDLDHVFRKSLFGKADLGLGEYAKLTLEGAVNIETEDWWLQPGFWWSLADAVEISVLVDLLGGPDDAFFGLFRENRRVQARVRYSF